MACRYHQLCPDRAISILKKLLTFIFLPNTILLFFLFTFILLITSTDAETKQLNKPKNSDLLAYKMFDDDLASPYRSDLTTLSRFQRHTRRHRNRENRNRKRHSTTMSPSSLASLQRSSFLSLRASNIGPSLGPAPTILAKRKQEFCKTVPYKQKISESGCESKTIINSYCFGACNSFYIPSDGNNSLPFTSCSFCLPRRYRWTTIRLRCPLYQDMDQDISENNNNSDSNKSLDDNQIVNEYGNDMSNTSNENNRRTIFAYRHKKIQIVTKCRCQAEMS